MGFLDGFLKIMNMNPDSEEDLYNDDYDYEDEEEVKPLRAAKSSFKAKREVEDDYEDDYKEKSVRTTKVTPIHQGKKTSVGNMKVCVIKPTSIEDEREITETLLEGRTVVLNMEGLNVEIAQRIIDFTSGSTFAIKGNLQKISNYIFIVTPASVDISGDVLSLIDSFDSKGF